MARTFNCPSCSAPLDFTGQVTQKCEHCGVTVIAPHEMSYDGNSSPFDDLSSLKGRALAIAEVQRLIHAGNKIEAIKVFREAFGTGLKESKDAVEAIERGESIDISDFRLQSMQPQQIKLNIDTKGVRKAAVSAGKAVLAVTMIAVVLVVGMGAAVAWFVFAPAGASVATSTPEGPTTTPNAKVGEASPLFEELKIGGEGNAPGRFRDNRHVAVDGEGRIYSSDYSPIRIQVFEADGTFLNQWLPEAGDNLHGLAVDREGTLLVANNRGLFKYEGKTGKMLAKVDGVYPRGMAFSWDGKIVITEGRTFSVYDKALKLISKFDDAAERVNSSFGFGAVAVAGDETIYMLGRTDKDVFKFTMDGKFLDRFPHGANSPNDIAIDPAGRIFISDTSSIKVFDAAGSKLADLKAFQAFGMTFGLNGELFLANRPFVTKYSIDL